MGGGGERAAGSAGADIEMTQCHVVGRDLPITAPVFPVGISQPNAFSVELPAAYMAFDVADLCSSLVKVCAAAVKTSLHCAPVSKGIIPDTNGALKTREVTKGDR